MRTPVLGQLVDTLAHARRSVPYYQALITEQEITEQNALSTLRELPVLTREQVRDRGARLWSVSGDTRAWRAVRTGGTTGVPIEIVLDETAQLAETASLYRHIERFLATDNWTDLSVMHLALHPAARSRAVSSPWAAMPGLVKWNLTRLWQQSDGLFLRGMTEIDGHVVTIMPSVAAMLIDRIRYKGRVQPRLVILSGESAEADLRRRISQVLDCPTTCLYTLAEVGIAATECQATTCYHVNDSDIVLELTDDNSESISITNKTGNVTITSLTNRAMPLLRYRTGDRGTWADQSCNCGQDGRLLRLDTARALAVVAEGNDGNKITNLDVAKLLSQMDVDSVRLSQDDRHVFLDYQAGIDMAAGPATAIASALRGLLGPGINVTLRRTSKSLASSSYTEDSAQTPQDPVPLQPGEIARWARRQLAGELGIVAAVITGSSLDPSSTSQFSDIDITMLIDGCPEDRHWRELAVAMHRHMSGLRVNITNRVRLTDAPLVTCRLLAEQYPILGDIAECGVAWPTVNAIRQEARFWAEEARAVLWSRLTTSDRSGIDPLREAWLGAKHSINSLRYHYLAQGIRITAARSILEIALTDDYPNAVATQTAFDIACEHRSPPRQIDAPDSYLINALTSIDNMRHNLPADDY